MPWFQPPLALVVEGLAVPKREFSVLNSVHIGLLDWKQGPQELRSYSVSVFSKGFSMWPRFLFVFVFPISSSSLGDSKLKIKTRLCAHLNQSHAPPTVQLSHCGCLISVACFPLQCAPCGWSGKATSCRSSCPSRTRYTSKERTTYEWMSHRDRPSATNRALHTFSSLWPRTLTACLMWSWG